MNIALLEDHPAMADIIITFLHLQGYQVQAYVDGLALLHEIMASSNGQARHVDLVILTDTISGSLTAYEVIMALRQHEGLPILVLSGSLQQETLLKSHFPDLLLLCKPFPIKDLLELVKQCEKRT